MSKLKLRNLVVCENVLIEDKSKKMSLINLFGWIGASDFPAIHPSFYIVSVVIGEIGIFKEIIEIVGEDDKTIASIEGAADVQNDEGNSMVANFRNTVFPKEGRYWIKVSLDGNVLTNKNDHFILIKK